MAFLVCLFTFVYLLIIVPAALGTTLGMHECYAALLLKLFQWGASKNYERRSDECDSNDEADENQLQSSKKLDCIIMREKSADIKLKLDSLEVASARSNTVKTLVDDSLEFITAGIESIIEDDVTSRFKAEELASWNLLTRTSFAYQHISWQLAILWLTGFLFRYLILAPIRIFGFLLGMAHLIAITSITALISDKKIKRWLNEHGMKLAMRVMCRSFSTIAHFHNRQNMATRNGICVANHTSPTDLLVLSCDNCYAMVGQSQGGLLGFVQRTLSKVTDHIWFNRTEANDRLLVIQRLREHAENTNKLPIVIFPEGTCINNTSIMMFKKGSFEVANTIYPIAMKYDSRLGDAFWNSSEQSYGEYCFRMMTSWAIMCDVWYLPPMHRQEGEDSISFALRVKHAIAEKGGLLELDWDGMLKRTKVPPKLVVAQQNRYWGSLSRKTTINYDRQASDQMLSKIVDEDEGDKAGDSHKSSDDLKQQNSG